MICDECGGQIFWQECPTGGWWCHEVHPYNGHDAVHQIHEALKVLVDPGIPYEHDEGDHNCGECWQCILGTILLADVLRKEIRKQEGLPT